MKARLFLVLAVCCFLVSLGLLLGLAISQGVQAKDPGIRTDFGRDLAYHDIDWKVNWPDMYAIPPGNVGIGITNPTEKFGVAGTIQMEGFKMPTDASNGYVLTSNASGVGTWQPKSASIWNHSRISIYNGLPPNNFAVLDLSSYVGNNYALVYIKIENYGGTPGQYKFVIPEDIGDVSNNGCSSAYVPEIGYVLVETDSSGVVLWECNTVTATELSLIGFIK